MNPLRIAFVADTINGEVGGGVVSAHRVVERLRRDHQVLVIAADDDGPGRLKGFTLPFRAQREMGFVMAQPDREKLEQLFADVDIVHLQFPFLLSLSALDAARAVGRPVVAAFHVQPENALLNVGIHAHWANDWVYRFWVRRLYNRVDAVVVPSAFAERKLRAHGLTTPATVISNGIPPDLAQPSAGRELAHRGFFLILMVGRLAAEKHPEVLLEAVKRSRHRDRIKVVLAGSGPRKRALEALAAELPRGAEIGFLPRERLIRLLKSADLMVHGSEVELEGIAVLEAMSAGLPVLIGAGSESAASELALGDAFRFPVGDAAALAAKIDALIEQPQVLARARLAYRAAAAQFDFEANVAKLVALYRTVLERSGDSGSASLRSLAAFRVEPPPVDRVANVF